jgi:hypothetical protein
MSLEKHMKKYLITTLVLITTGLCANAEVISVDLGKANTEALESEDVAGVVPVANWDVASGFPDLTAFALTSGAIVTADFSGNLTTSVGVTADVNTEMFNSGGGVNSGTGSDITFANLPTTGVWSGGYDVYVYFAPSSGNNTLDLTIGDTTYYAQLDSGSSNYSGSFDQVTSELNYARESGNYVKFSGISGNSFTLKASSNIGNTIAITGMQIVSVPEPATMGLLASGGIIALLFRRRLLA